MADLTHNRGGTDVVVDIMVNYRCLMGTIEFNNRVNHFNNLVNQHRQVLRDPKVNCGNQDDIGDDHRQGRWDFRQPSLNPPHPINHNKGQNKGKQDQVHHWPHQPENQNDQHQHHKAAQTHIINKTMPDICHIVVPPKRYSVLNLTGLFNSWQSINRKSTWASVIINCILCERRIRLKC